MPSIQLVFKKINLFGSVVYVVSSLIYIPFEALSSYSNYVVLPVYAAVTPP